MRRTDAADASRQSPGFLIECIRDESDRFGGHSMVILETMITGRCAGDSFTGIERQRVWNAKRAEFALQPGGTVVPVEISRIAGKPLVTRPVERMHVEDGSVLPGSLHIAVGLPERVVIFAVNAFVTFPHRQMKIDRGGDGGRHREERGMTVGDAERSLAPHARAEQGDSGWLDAKPPFDLSPHLLHDEPLGRDGLVEAGHDPIEPPRTARSRRERGQCGRLERVAEAG